MQLIDSHCHLDLDPFEVDRNAVIQRAADHQVTDIIVPAVMASTWTDLQSLTQLAAPVNIHAAYGLHPVFDSQHQPDDIDRLDRCLATNHCVAVGECGLDFFIEEYDQSSQMRYFTEQLDLAVTHKLPVIIHSRKSLDLVLRELRLRPSLSGVVHSFSGSPQQAKQLIDLGFYLGFGGPITYPRATKLRKLVTELPLDALLLETDAPDQPDIERRGQRNEPFWLSNIAKCVAELRQCSLKTVCDITTKNSQQLFSI